MTLSSMLEKIMQIRLLSLDTYSIDDSIDDLGEEFDAHNIDFEDGLEDVEEVVDFGVVTECFFVVGLDQDM